MNSLVKKLSKLLPANDKLKHYFLGSIIFFSFSIIVNNLLALIINLVIAVAWEIWQKYNGGTNTIKEMTLDIIFSILTGLLVLITQNLI